MIALGILLIILYFTYRAVRAFWNIPPVPVNTSQEDLQSENVFTFKPNAEGDEEDEEDEGAENATNSRDKEWGDFNEWRRQRDDIHLTAHNALTDNHGTWGTNDSMFD